MTSNDNQQYLTVELFNSKMDTLMTQIQLGNEKLRSELHSEIQEVKSIALVNSARIDMLQHTFYWGFAIMTLIITIVAVLVPYFLRERKEHTQEEPQKHNLTLRDNNRHVGNEALSNISTIGK